MEKHRGEIVETAIRKSGYNIKKLAERLNISRNTLYNRLKDPLLSYSFIVQIGDVIHYDFSSDFPEIKRESSLTPEGYTASSYIHPSITELRSLKRKYIGLLECYDKLLCILIRMANENDLPAIKKEITHFLNHVV